MCYFVCLEYSFLTSMNPTHSHLADFNSKATSSRTSSRTTKSKVASYIPTLQPCCGQCPHGACFSFTTVLTVQCCHLICFCRFLITFILCPGTQRDRRQAPQEKQRGQRLRSFRAATGEGKVKDGTEACFSSTQGGDLL
jgi:hypothetical protein